MMNIDVVTTNASPCGIIVTARMIVVITATNKVAVCISWFVKKQNVSYVYSVGFCKAIYNFFDAFLFLIDIIECFSDGDCSSDRPRCRNGICIGTK